MLDQLVGAQQSGHVQSLSDWSMTLPGSFPQIRSRPLKMYWLPLMTVLRIR
jgi:hypothetical protein